MLTIIIAPTNKCNLNCTYCFNQYNRSEDIIDISTIEYLIDLSFKENDCVNFVWRGGEPLMVGMRFYKKVLAIQKQYSLRYGTIYHNSIQTNGTLINKRWISFFKRHQISLGISFDGLNNDVYRSEGSKTIEAFKLCKSLNYKVGCLVVVNKENIDLINQYNFLKQYVTSIRFNPCFETNNIAYKISAKEYAENMLDLFCKWALDKDNIQVSPLVDYVSDVLGVYQRRECINGKCLGKFLDISSAGVVRICSHSSEKKYELGYIDQFSSLTEIFNCESFNGVVKEMIVRNKGCKENCELYRFCQGGCCVSRIANNSFNCEYLKELYPEIKKRVKRIISDNKNLQGYNKQFRNCVWDSISQKPDLLINMIEN